MLACSFELSGNMFSMLCALGSTLVFVTQNIYSKKFLPKEDGSTSQSNLNDQSGKVDKLTLLLFSSGMAFIGLIPLWLYSDLSSLIDFFFYSDTPNPNFQLSSIAWYFFMNGTTHFAQNLLAFTILARTSPVTYSIASLIKRIAVIVIAIVWFGQSVGIIQSLGISLTFFGLWLYNRSKSDVDKGERKRGNVERRNEILLPSSRSDAQILERSPGLSQRVFV
jgi:solute carrier family 35, member E1